MYVRFIVNAIDEDSRRREGVFCAAYAVYRADWMSSAEAAHYRRIIRWFSTYLCVPTRLARSRRRYAHAEGICWFKPTACEHIARMRDLCRLLEECGTWTAQITARSPGYIVYEDRHQVCAVPFADTKA